MFYINFEILKMDSILQLHLHLETQMNIYFI